VNFGEGVAYFAETACRIRPKSRLFSGVGGSRFTVPYTFAVPGVHQVKVTMLSGACGRARKSNTQVVTIDAAPGIALRPVADAQADDCPGADAVPTASNVAALEDATICLMNKERAAHRLRELQPNAKLRKAGQLHNKYMTRGEFFAHQGPGEPPLEKRLRRAGYRASGGENLGCAGGTQYSSPAVMMSLWMKSPVHRANILEKRYFTVGVAAIPRKPAPKPFTPGVTYTVEFGTGKK
jgi:uncharacterized protein YkwD